MEKLLSKLHLKMKKIVSVLVMLFMLNLLVSHAQNAEIIQNKDKFGISENGKVLIKPKFFALNKINSDLFAAKDKKGLYGIINKWGISIVPYIYDDIKPFFESTFLVEKDGKWGLINRSNKEVLPIEYTNLKFINKYLCQIQDHNKIGLINKYGDIITKPKYEQLTPFLNSFFLIKKDGKFGIIDGSGKELVSPDYDGFEKLANTDLLRSRKNNKIGLVDTLGQVIIEAKYDSISNGIVGKIVHNNNKIGFLTESGKLVEPVFDKIAFSQPELRLVVVKKGNKLGFVTANGTFIEPMYENISRFSNNGIAFVEKDGKLMAIDINGKELRVQEIMQNGPASL